MLRAILAAAALASGMPMVLVAALWAATSVPALGAGALAVLAVVDRRRRQGATPGPDDEAAFLHGLASEMAGGAAPRSALASAAERVPRLRLGAAVRLARAGMAAERIAPALAEGLPVNGRLTAGAWVLAARSGGPAVGVFQSLALRTAEEGALRRERRALTAQARASAWVVAGLPILLLAALAMTGRLPLGDPALAGVVAVGVALQAAGVAVVVAMVRRAR